jgi:hypothetical protein
MFSSMSRHTHHERKWLSKRALLFVYLHLSRKESPTLFYRAIIGHVATVLV